MEDKIEQNHKKIFRSRTSDVWLLLICKGNFEMDYEEIKELAIKKRWGEEGRYGDDYRNLSKQIDNFIVHLKKEDSPLEWLPLHLLNSQEIADLICTYLDRSAENRLLLDNLGYKGIKYDYSDLLVVDPRRKQEMESILELEARFADIEPLKIYELKEHINIALVGAKYEGYIKTANSFVHTIDTIRKEIWDEKNLYKCLGLGYLNMGYIEQFIMIAERICFGSLFYFLMENDKVNDKLSSLLQFEKMLNEIDETLREETDAAKIKYKKNREFHEEYRKIPAREMDEISLYFVQFLERKAYYDELDNISDFLVAGTVKESQIEKESCIGYGDEIDDYKDTRLKEYLTGGINVPNYDKKLKDVIELMKFAREKAGYWASSNNPIDLKIAFQELMIYNDKYNHLRQKTLTIVRDILSSHQPSREQLMFLDLKITRGYFREWMQEYGIYTRICKKTRKMFLNCYSAINDVEAHRLIHRTCYEFLYLLCVPDYSGIKVE